MVRHQAWLRGGTKKKDEAGPGDAFADCSSFSDQDSAGSCGQSTREVEHKRSSLTGFCSGTIGFPLSLPADETVLLDPYVNMG